MNTDLVKSFLLTRIKYRMSILKNVCPDFEDPPDLDVSTLEDLRKIDRFLEEQCIKLFIPEKK